MTFRLIYQDDSTAHGDMWWEIGETRFGGDSYYLSLDSRIMPRDHTPPKVREVLRSMCDQWQVAAGAVPSSKCWLLVDLADQYTRWVELEQTGTGLQLQPGWSSREGFRVSPSRDAVRTSPPADFEPMGETAHITVQELQRSIARIRAMLDIQETSSTDPTSILEHYRGTYGSQLLVAAVAHLNFFGLLADQPLPRRKLQSALGLADRSFTVLTTALRAMDLLQVEGNFYAVTETALNHLTAGPFDMRDYIGLMASSPDVVEMVERLRSNRPAQGDAGTAFIYREGVRSAMDSSGLARYFTNSLAGRAKIVAPVLARQLALPPDRPTTLLDVGGGSGIYSIALLARHPQLTATVLDRKEVLEVAAEFAERYGVEDRLTLLPGDMFQTPLPASDYVLLSNILHDWDVPECQQLVNRCTGALNPGGQLLVHDVFLHDDHSGPLPIALYSAALFTLTEGRAYSVAEYTDWLTAAGLQVSGPVSTAVHCGVLTGSRP